MEFKKYFESQQFKVVTWVVACLIVLLFVFKAGVMIGYHKAGFSYRWGENYHRNFGGPRDGFMGMMRGFDDKSFIDANGVFGQVIKVADDALVIRGRDNVERLIVVDSTTVVRRLRDTVTFADLKVNDVIVVIGEPNEHGQIVAKLIRLMPPLPSPSMMQPTR